MNEQRLQLIDLSLCLVDWENLFSLSESDEVKKVIKEDHMVPLQQRIRELREKMGIEEENE